MAVVIKKCGCKPDNSKASTYQDGKYGKDMRVCNLNQKGTDAKCSVCNKQHKV